MSNVTYVAGIVAGILGHIGTSAAAAVAADASTGEPSASAALEEVLVTAQRRSTRLQEVPFSIVAFAGEQIEEQRIEAPLDLMAKIPGAVYLTNFKTNSFVSIRGFLSTEDSPAADLPVAFFVDDIYVHKPADLQLNYFDLERIEVLRGPQGTLFGRNVTGGAVSVVSKRPSFTDAAALRITVGNERKADFDGYATGTLIDDTLAGRFSFSARSRDGLIPNRVRSEDLLDADTQSVRGQLLFTPTSDLDVTLSADYTWDRGKGAAFKMIGFNPVLIADTSPDPFVSDQDFASPYDRDLWGASAHVDWRTGVGDFTSISGYRRSQAVASRDVDATAAPILGVTEFLNDWQFSQEFRLASPADERISYVAGLFFLNASNYKNKRQFYAPVPGTLLSLAVPAPTRDDQRQQVSIQSIAPFGELTVRLTDTLSASIGGRWTRDKKEGTTTLVGDPHPSIKPTTQDVAVDFSESWTAFTPRFVLRYVPNDDLNWYLTVARGFKSGGFPCCVPASAATATAPLGANLAVPFEPEFTINYEVGLKSQLLDGRMLLNVDVFRQDTDDLQVRGFSSTGQAIITNAGEAYQQGVELESSLLITDNFQVDLSYAYLDAQFEKYLIPPTTDFSGKRLPFAPKHSLTLGGRYTWTVSGGATVAIAGDYTYRSEIPLVEANNVADELTQLSEWNVANASLSYTAADERWEVSLWGKNITNEAVLIGAFDLTSFYATPQERSAGNRGFVAFFNEPRTYGASLTYRW